MADLRIETLYLDNVNFNNALVINALADIVLANGGAIEKPKYNTCVFYRRHVIERKKELTEIIERMNAKTELNDTQTRYLNDLNREYKTIKNLDKAYKCNYSSYLRFIYHNNIYYFEMNDNPLFDYHYLKHGFKGFNEKTSRDFYLEKFNMNKCIAKSNFDIWSYYTTKENAHTLANEIFTELAKSKLSGYYKNKRPRFETYNEIDFIQGV